MEMRKKAETKEREIATGYFSKRIYGDACGTGNSCYAYYSFKTGESIKPIEYEQKYLKFIKKRKEGRNFLNTSETLNENGHTIRKSQLKMVCEKIDDEDFPYDCRMPKLVMRTENSAISFDEDGDKYENIDIDFDEDGDKYENIEGVYAALNSVDKHQNMKRNGVIKTETTNHTEYHCCQHISTSPCSTSLKLMEKAFVMEPTTISSSVESETPILSTGQSLSDRSNSLTPRSIEAVMRKPVLFHSPNTELAAAEKRLYTEIKGAISRFSEEVRLIRLARHKSEKYTFCDNSDCA
uniref:Uncharacterized protein n=3 Tax=Corethron hystrix TaxID=216773 RepID=A0A7S1BC53_9STRA|mmetsp:Transcript_19740/g.44821  ORF Transcript_19740/g.44821 Transcript_19740/m.44821 type:complete len:295 (+) Transcript_19740:2-886(+)